MDCGKKLSHAGIKCEFSQIVLIHSLSLRPLFIVKIIFREIIRRERKRSPTATEMILTVADAFQALRFSE